MSIVQYEFQFDFFVFLLKKHSCPNCTFKKLKTTYSIVDVLETGEANLNQFKLGRHYFPGEKVIKKPYLYCEKCGSKFSIDEIKKLERERKTGDG